MFNPFFDKTINKICIYYFYSYISAHTVFKDLGRYLYESKIFIEYKVGKHTEIP